jgi:hypothetical protein
MILGSYTKKSELEIVKYGYIRGCPKEPTTQIWSLEILGVNPTMAHYWVEI